MNSTENLFQKLFEDLERVGYTETYTNESEFLQISKLLGNIIPSRGKSGDVDVLRPTDEEDAHPFSMSRKYGKGAFPFHTDGAYLRIPPKYIVLRANEENSNPVPTEIWSVKSFCSKDLLDSLKFELWIVNGRKGAFYSTIVSDNTVIGQTIFRIDPCCMKPFNKDCEGSTKLNELLDSIPPIQIKWEPNKTLILNNWAFLHSRPEIKTTNQTRTLQRTMIDG